MRAVEWLAVLGLASLWGLSFFFVELALPSFAPFTLVFVRVALACGLMFWLIRRHRSRRIIRNRWRLYILLGFFSSAFPFLCFSWGQQYIESGLASILNALTPLFILLFALVIGRERYSGIRAFGLLLGFGGVVVLMKPDTAASEWGGIIAACLAATSYAIGTHIAWGRATRYSVRENAYGQLFFASLLLLPFTLYEQPWQADFQPLAVAAVIMLGILSTFFAYLIYYYLLHMTGGVNAMLSVLLVPVVAVTLGIVFLDEHFSSRFLIGGGLIIVGIVLSDEKLRARLRRVFLSRAS